MIRCERGKIQISGSGAEIYMDLKMIIREVRNALSELIGTDGAEKVIAKIIEESRKSDDEIEMEIRDMAKKVADKLLKDIFGDAKEGEYMSDAEKREKLHQILDLVIDINGFEDRKVELTGDKPTVFFRFSGHVSLIEVDVNSHGYNGDLPDVRMEDYIEEENPKLDEMIQKLEEIKDGTYTGI